MSLTSPWLLRDDIRYLNHGSFGATPRPVFEAYQHWQRELESQPTEFLGRRAEGLLREARQPLADFLGTHPDRLAFLVNATTAVNQVAWSLQLGPDDEVLLNNHEYGAVLSCWQHLSQRFGFRVVRVPLRLPVASPEQVVESLWAAVTPRTRLICLSHITSPTALLFPVRDVCQRARAHGILTLIDGAHGPGQVDLRLDRLGADFYAGNLHKWMCAPKGAAFLYCAPQAQELLRPLVISWALEAGHGNPHGASPEPDWVSVIQLQGTRDLASFLAVPAAVAFAREQSEERARCRQLAGQVQARLCEELDCSRPGYSSELQMAAVMLPEGTDALALKNALWDEERIEVPVYGFAGRTLLRISAQSYNTLEDYQALLEALRRRL